MCEGRGMYHDDLVGLPVPQSSSFQRNLSKATSRNQSWRDEGIFTTKNGASCSSSRT
jgi:hypothetical protein